MVEKNQALMDGLRQIIRRGLLAMFLILLNFSFSIAQEDLVGSWVSYSSISRGREFVIDNKHNKTIITFRRNQHFVERFYGLKEDLPDSSFKIQYSSSLDGETTMMDANGKILKQGWIKTKGTYQVTKDSIFRLNRRGLYDHGQYRVSDKVLSLIDSTDGGGLFKTKRMLVRKYKRVSQLKGTIVAIRYRLPNPKRGKKIDYTRAPTRDVRSSPSPSE